MIGERNTMGWRVSGSEKAAIAITDFLKQNTAAEGVLEHKSICKVLKMSFLGIVNTKAVHGGLDNKTHPNSTTCGDEKEKGVVRKQ